MAAPERKRKEKKKGKRAGNLLSKFAVALPIV
jgi:hypothetical protein